MTFSYEEFDLSDVRTYPLDSRASKARIEDFARPVTAGATFKEWYDSLSAILGAADLRRAVNAIAAARQRGAGIVWGIGAHVIKTGVSPVLIDLMRRGYISALAMNGAGVIHDFEVALAGATSENVDEALGPGRFGMAEETGRDGTTITIRVTHTMPADPETVCTAIYGYHESTVELGTDFVSGTEYTVKVNDKETTFTAK